MALGVFVVSGQPLTAYQAQSFTIITPEEHNLKTTANANDFPPSSFTITSTARPRPDDSNENSITFTNDQRQVLSGTSMDGKFVGRIFGKYLKRKNIPKFVRESHMSRAEKRTFSETSTSVQQLQRRI